MKDSKPFSCFGDFWQLTQDLDEFQRNKILNSLSEEEKDNLLKEIKNENWDELIYRNKIDKLIDEIKETFNFDMLDIRRKIIKGKSQYITQECWEYFISCLFEMDLEPEHYRYVIGGIKAETDGELICLIPSVKREKHGSKEDS